MALVRAQDAIRARLVETQRELAEMGERQYRKLVREGERMKELAAKEDVRRAKREKEEHFKQIKEWRRVVAEAASDARELAPRVTAPCSKRTRRWPRTTRVVVGTSRRRRRARRRR